MAGEMKVKMTSQQGSKRIEFENEYAKGYIWLSYMASAGVTRIVIEGEGFFDIENNVKEAK